MEVNSFILYPIMLQLWVSTIMHPYEDHVRGEYLSPIIQAMHEMYVDHLKTPMFFYCYRFGEPNIKTILEDKANDLVFLDHFQHQEFMEEYNPHPSGEFIGIANKNFITKERNILIQKQAFYVISHVKKVKVMKHELLHLLNMDHTQPKKLHLMNHKLSKMKDVILPESMWQWQNLFDRKLEDGRVEINRNLDIDLFHYKLREYRKFHNTACPDFVMHKGFRRNK